MRRVKIAATQMACSSDIHANIANAEKLVSDYPEIGKFGRDQGFRTILPQAYS